MRWSELIGLCPFAIAQLIQIICGSAEVVGNLVTVEEFAGSVTLSDPQGRRFTNGPYYYYYYCCCCKRGVLISAGIGCKLQTLAF